MSTFILDAYWGSDPGRMRDHNEDAITGTPFDSPAAPARDHLFIVADGMGGHNAGEVASNEAVKRVYQRYYADPDPDVFRSLERAMRLVNNELYQSAQSDPAQHGMGTTMTALAIKQDHLVVAHVGDSRLYLLREGKIELVTRDHSWVEEQVRAGVLTRQQAESHPQRNVITRALATGPDVQVDAFERDLRAGDILIFSSDGLTTEVDEAQIAAVATKATTAREGVQRLIQLANDNGGEDNVSVGIVRVLDATGVPTAGMSSEAITTPALPLSVRRSLLPLIGGVMVLLILVAALALIAGGGSRARGGAKVTVPAVSPTVNLPTSTPKVSAEGQAAGGVAANNERPTQGATTAAATQPTVTLAPAVVAAQATATPPPASKGAALTLDVKEASPTAEIIATPVLVEPPRDETVKGRITFRWEPVNLPAGAAYEVVWWRQDEDPINARGFAPPTTQTWLTTDLEGHGLQLDQIFYWTVLVVRTSPTYRRLQAASLANSRTLAYK